MGGREVKLNLALRTVLSFKRSLTLNPSPGAVKGESDDGAGRGRIVGVLQGLTVKPGTIPPPQRVFEKRSWI
jgi:hypothetical protein